MQSRRKDAPDQENELLVENLWFLWLSAANSSQFIHVQYLCKHGA